MFGNYATLQCEITNTQSSNPHEQSERDYEMMREEGDSSDEGVNLNTRSSDTETAVDYVHSPKRSSSDATKMG